MLTFHYSCHWFFSAFFTTIVKTWPPIPQS